MVVPDVPRMVPGSDFKTLTALGYHSVVLVSEQQIVEHLDVMIKDRDSCRYVFIS